MILTVTMNPAIDKITSVEKMIPEKKLRCSEIKVEPGGGGINVAKTINRLGGECVALFPSGGHNGLLLKQMLKAQKISYKTIEVQGKTRADFTVTELSTSLQYRFVTQGSSLALEDMQVCIECIEAFDPRPEIIVISGSLPPGVPDDFIARVAALSKEVGAKCIVDTSGQPLKLAANEGVYLLKPNLTELCSLVGKEYLQLDEVEEAANAVIQNGYCEAMVVSMGPAGALLVTKTMHERIVAPTVKKLTTVGAGDSMVGGMAWMLQLSASLPEVARFGVACGTAATMSHDSLFNVDDAFKIYDWLNAKRKIVLV